jgi:glucose/arabinose dehydrogenase
MKGMRNPWRWSFDRETDDLWIGDVGQDDIEEIDVVPAGSIDGANGGWPIFEGNAEFDGGDPPPGYVPPVYTYDHGDGISVVGGYVYRGTAIQPLRGAYLFADTYTGFVRAIVVADGEVTQERQLLEMGDASFASFGEDADGELYLLGLNGGVWRIEAA